MRDPGSMAYLLTPHSGVMLGGVPVFVNQCVPLVAVDLWGH